MRLLLSRSLFLLAVLLLPPLGRAADDPRTTALKAADDERVAATVAVNRARLNAILSDDLHYAHASGAVDTKSSFLTALETGKLKYTAMEYEERKFTVPVEHLALMTGRVHLQLASASGPVDLQMSYLGVWREEGGHWKFLAWQSSKLPPAPAAK